MSTYPQIVGGREDSRGTKIRVISPYDGSEAGVSFLAPPEVVEEAVTEVLAGAEDMRTMPSYRRAEILNGIGMRIAAERENIARLMTMESGKPIRDARTEVDRAVLTMRTAAEEATRIYGEVIPLDFLPAMADRFGITRKVPIGPVLAITPFNFPLNLVCHKLGPAIAAGNSILIKPAPKTPLTAIRLGQIALESGFPAQALSVVNCDNLAAQSLVTDDRFKALSFTGSDVVGWKLKALAGKKKVMLELGGNAGVIVDETADVDLAASRIVAGGFGYSGQSCISVQRIYAHEAIYDDLRDKVCVRARELRLGDPLQDETDVGPMIDAGAVERIEAWIESAVSDGAEVLVGGKSQGPIFEPTVMANVPSGSRLCTDEAFAPVVVLDRFHEFDDAVTSMNQSRFGLQAGIFTRDLNHVFRAFTDLEVGGVIVNDVPTFRADPMPYGGVKDSGLGREGVRFAIEELTETRLLVLRSGG